jgi:hypothetical protein
MNLIIRKSRFKASLVFLAIFVFIVLLSPSLCKADGCIAYPYMVEGANGTCVCGSGYVWNGSSCISVQSYCWSNYGTYSQYDYTSNSCKCINGSLWGKSYSGGLYCIEGSTYCSLNYGAGSQYDLNSNSCKCAIGYIVQQDTFGNSSCVSGTTACWNKYGINSQFDYTSGRCICISGYIFSNDSSGNSKCLDVNSVCQNKFGLNSKYNPETAKCECNSGYIFNSANQCVGNYFKLIEIDTTNKKVIIKSDADGAYYAVEYGLGCYDSSFSQYLNKDVAVDFGIGIDLAIGDKIILQNDNETCEIKSGAKVESTFTLSPTGTQKNNSGSTITCPENANLKTDGKCYCNDGYILDSSKTSCAIKPCPLNAQQYFNSCLCNSGYVMTNGNCSIVGTKKQYLTTSNSINIRQQSNSISKVIGKTIPKTKYEVTDLSNKDWVKIKFNGKEGFVSKKLALIK